MNKPRTFYTDGDVVRESDSEDIKQLRSGGFDLIEVIEKSAYDALLAQNKLLAEALEFYADLDNPGIVARQALSKIKADLNE